MAGAAGRCGVSMGCSTLVVRHPRIRPRLALLSMVILLLLTPERAALAARSAAIVVDYATGAVLHSETADASVYPASLTKAMTLYLTFEALRSGRLELEQRLPVSARAAAMAPTKLGLKAGTTIRTRDAILSLITKSANDAAVVLAEALAGSEPAFGRAMTAKAKLLGMSRSVFHNASGLPHPEQRTTARDMARLGVRLIKDFPEYYRWFATPQFTYSGRTHRNHNNLLASYKGMDGLKTGYIRASGFNLLASAERNGRRLVAAVFGGSNARSRDATMAKLLDRSFAEVAIAAAGKLTDEPAVREDADVLLASAGAAAYGDRAQGDIDAASGVKPTAKTPARKKSVVAAVPAAPRAAAKPAKRGGYSVQVGAFGQRAQAQRAAANAVRLVPSLLKASAAQVQPSKTKKRTLFRALLVGLKHDDAQSACRQLKRKGTDCLVLRAGS